VAVLVAIVPSVLVVAVVVLMRRQQMLMGFSH
jgi:hypothetical protein